MLVVYHVGVDHIVVDDGISVGCVLPSYTKKKR